MNTFSANTISDKTKEAGNYLKDYKSNADKFNDKLNRTTEDKSRQAYLRNQINSEVSSSIKDSEGNVKIQKNSSLNGSVNGDVSYGGFTGSSNVNFETNKASVEKNRHVAMIKNMTKSHLESMNKLSKLDDSMKRIAQFQTTVQADYYKNSLENQVKMLTTMDQIKNALFIGFNIDPRTGRKEETKEETTEMSTVRKLMFGKGRAGVKEAFREIISRASESGKTNIMSMIPFSEVIDTLATFDKSEMGTIITSLIKSSAKDGIRSLAKDRIKNKDIFGMLSDPDTTLKRILNSKESGLNTLLKTLLGVENTESKKFKNRLSYSDKLKEDIKRDRATFDGKAYHSLTYLIPELLKQQVDILSGGQTSGKIFSYEKGKWINSVDAEKERGEYNTTREYRQFKSHINNNLVNVKVNIDNNGNRIVTGGFIKKIEKMLSSSSPTTDNLKNLKENLVNLIKTIRDIDTSIVGNSNEATPPYEYQINSMLATLIVDKSTMGLSSEDIEQVEKSQLENYLESYFRLISSGNLENSRNTIRETLKRIAYNMMVTRGSKMSSELIEITTEIFMLSAEYITKNKEKYLLDELKSITTDYINMEMYNIKEQDDPLHGQIGSSLNVDFTKLSFGNISSTILGGSKSRGSLKADHNKGISGTRTVTTSTNDGTDNKVAEFKRDLINYFKVKGFDGVLNILSKTGRLGLPIINNGTKYIYYGFKNSDSMLKKNERVSNIDIIRIYDKQDDIDPKTDNGRIIYNHKEKDNNKLKDMLTMLIDGIVSQVEHELNNLDDEDRFVFNSLKNLIESDDTKQTNPNIFGNSDMFREFNDESISALNSYAKSSEEYRNRVAREQAIKTLAGKRYTTEVMLLLEKYDALVRNKEKDGATREAAMKHVSAGFKKFLGAIMGTAEFEKLYKELYGNGDGQNGAIGELTGVYASKIGTSEWNQIVEENSGLDNSFKSKISNAMNAGSPEEIMTELAKLSNDPKNGALFKRLIGGVGGLGVGGLSVFMGDGLIAGGAKGFLMQSRLRNNSAFKRLQELHTDEKMKEMDEHEWELEKLKSMEELQNSLAGLAGGNIMGSAVNKWMKHNLRFGGVLGFVSNLAISAVAPFVLKPLISGAKRLGVWALKKVFGQDAITDRQADLENIIKNRNGEERRTAFDAYGSNREEKKTVTDNILDSLNSLKGERQSATRGSRFNVMSSADGPLGLYKNYNSKLSGKTCAAESLAAIFSILFGKAKSATSPINPMAFADIQIKYTNNNGTSPTFYKAALKAISKKHNTISFEKIHGFENDNFVTMTGIINTLKTSPEGSVGFILNIRTDQATGEKANHAVALGYSGRKFKYFDANLNAENFIDLSEEKIMELVTRLVAVYKFTKNIDDVDLLHDTKSKLFKNRIKAFSENAIDGATNDKISFGNDVRSSFNKDLGDGSVIGEARKTLSGFKEGKLKNSEILKNFNVNATPKQLYKLLGEVAGTSELTDEEKKHVRSMQSILKKVSADDIEEDNKKEEKKDEKKSLLARGWDWLKNVAFPGLGSGLKWIGSTLMSLAGGFGSLLASLGIGYLAMKGTDFVMDKTLDFVSDKTGFDVSSDYGNKSLKEQLTSGGKYGLMKAGASVGLSAKKGFLQGFIKGGKGILKESSDELIEKSIPAAKEAVESIIHGGKGLSNEAMVGRFAKLFDDMIVKFTRWFGKAKWVVKLTAKIGSWKDKLAKVIVEALEKAASKIGTTKVGSKILGTIKGLAGFAGGYGLAAIALTFGAYDAYKGWREADEIFDYKYNGMASTTQKVCGAIAGFLTSIIPAVPPFNTWGIVATLVFGTTMAWLRDPIAKCIYWVLSGLGLDNPLTDEELKALEKKVTTDLSKESNEKKLQYLTAGIANSGDDRIIDKQKSAADAVTKKVEVKASGGAGILGGGMAADVASTVSKTTMTKLAGKDVSSMVGLPTFVSQKDFSHINLGGMNAVLNGCALACAKMIIEYYEKEVSDEDLLEQTGKFLLSDSMISTDYFAMLNGKKISGANYENKLKIMNDGMLVLLIGTGSSNHFITILKKKGSLYIGDPMNDSWRGTTTSEVLSLSIKHMREFDKTKGLNLNPSPELLGGGSWFSKVGSWIKEKFTGSSSSSSSSSANNDISVDDVASTVNTNSNRSSRVIGGTVKGNTGTNSLIEMQQNLRFGRGSHKMNVAKQSLSLMGADASGGVEDSGSAGDNGYSDEGYGTQKWISIAKSFENQIAVPKDEKSINANQKGGKLVMEFMSTAVEGQYPPTSVKNHGTNWCAQFVSYCLLRSGIKLNPKGKNYSSSQFPTRDSDFEKIENPIHGAIAVVKRDNNSGHVLFIISSNSSSITIIGGNQGIAKGSNDRGVTIRSYKSMEEYCRLLKVTFVGYYWPKGVSKQASGGGNVSVNRNYSSKFSDQMEFLMTELEDRITPSGKPDVVHGSKYIPIYGLNYEPKTGKNKHVYDALMKYWNNGKKEEDLKIVKDMVKDIYYNHYWMKGNSNEGNLNDINNEKLRFAIMNSRTHGYKAPSIAKYLKGKGYKVRGTAKGLFEDVKQLSNSMSEAENNKLIDAWLQAQQNYTDHLDSKHNHAKQGYRNRISKIYSYLGVPRGAASGKSAIYNSAKDLLKRMKTYSQMNDAICGPYALGSLATGTAATTVDDFMNLVEKWFRNGVIEKEGMSSEILDKLGFVISGSLNNKINSVQSSLISGSSQFIDPKKVYVMNTFRGSTAHWVSAMNTDEKLIVFDMKYRAGVSSFLDDANDINVIYECDAKLFIDNIKKIISLETSNNSNMKSIGSTNTQTMITSGIKQIQPNSVTINNNTPVSNGTANTVSSKISSAMSTASKVIGDIAKDSSTDLVNAALETNRLLGDLLGINKDILDENKSQTTAIKTKNDSGINTNMQSTDKIFDKLHKKSEEWRQNPTS